LQKASAGWAMTPTTRQVTIVYCGASHCKSACQNGDLELDTIFLRKLFLVQELAWTCIKIQRKRLAQISWTVERWTCARGI